MIILIWTNHQTDLPNIFWRIMGSRIPQPPLYPQRRSRPSNPGCLLRCSNVVVLRPTNHEYWSPQEGGHPRIWTPSQPGNFSVLGCSNVSESPTAWSKHINWMVSLFETNYKELQLFFWICPHFELTKSQMSCHAWEQNHLTPSNRSLRKSSHTKTPFVRQKPWRKMWANST